LPDLDAQPLLPEVFMWVLRELYQRGRAPERRHDVARAWSNAAERFGEPAERLEA
jgi:hypothetical protein